MTTVMDCTTSPINSPFSRLQFVGVQLYFTPLVYGNRVTAKGADAVVGLVLEPFHGKMRRVGLLFTVVQPRDQILEAISHLETFLLPEIVVV
jgi:hypothetical protein